MTTPPWEDQLGVSSATLRRRVGTDRPWRRFAAVAVTGAVGLTGLATLSTGARQRTIASSTTSARCAVRPQAPLHVANGKIVDVQNRYVPLHGAETDLMLGSAGGPLADYPPEAAWINQNFCENLVRININIWWWYTNVMVPDANAHFQDVVKAKVQAYLDQGDYVLLDKGPTFHMPPCGGTNTQCPSQNQGTKVVPLDPAQETKGDCYQMSPTPSAACGNNRTPFGYGSPAVEVMTQLAQLYGNNPAVLYDTWNEPHVSGPTWVAMQTAIIGGIRKYAPNSLVFTEFEPKDEPDVQTLAANGIKNLVFEYHLYPGASGQIGFGSPPFIGDSLRNPNIAICYCEFNFAIHNGSQLTVPPQTVAATDALTQHAIAQGYSVSFFNQGNLYQGKSPATWQLTPEGQLIQKEFALLGGSPSGGPQPSPSASPSSSPDPSTSPRPTGSPIPSASPKGRPSPSPKTSPSPSPSADPGPKDRDHRRDGCGDDGGPILRNCPVPAD